MTTLATFWRTDMSRYIEPFAGSACLFFHLEPEEAVLGDLNAELILTYRSVMHDVERVIEAIRRLPRGEAAYYRIRSISPQDLSLPERAARFIYLNRFCFNGLYRTNQQGEFNVPYGDCKGHDGIDEALLRAASSVLQRATLIAGDFEATLEHAAPGDFVYMDPPYVVTHRRTFAQYNPTGFASPDVERVASILETLDARGISFLVSYADAPEAHVFTHRWESIKVRTKRNISGFAHTRRQAHEVLVTNIERRSGNASH